MFSFKLLYGVPPYPRARDVCAIGYVCRVSGVRYVFDAAKNFPNLKNAGIYIMSFREFFEKAPTHNLVIGDIVTCNCHGGLAIILEIYDEEKEVDGVYHPSMNMAKIWWMRYPHSGIKERIWMHTIAKLRKHPEYSGLQKMPPKKF